MATIAAPTDKELFQKISEQLTTQHLGSLFDEIYDYITCEDPDQHKFITNHPECMWFMSAVRTAYQSYFCKEYNKYNKTQLTPTVQATIIRGTLERIAHLLVEKFHIFTANLEYDFIIALAGEKYESQASENLSIVILPEFEIVKHQQTASFLFSPANQLQLNYTHVHAIRKQMNLAHKIDVGEKNEKRVLGIAKDYTRDSYYTVGIFPDSILCRCPSISFGKGSSWEFRVPAPSLPSQNGHTMCILRYYHGTLMLPSLNLRPELMATLQPLFRTYDKSQTICKTVVDITLQINSGSGAILIFGDARFIKKQAKSLVDDLGRGMLLPTPVSLKNTEELTKRLSGIDGALLVDYQGRCHAYGVILDGIAMSQGNIGRGSRYNSTMTYIDSRAKRLRKSVILGIVKSEDGMLDVFH